MTTEITLYDNAFKYMLDGTIDLDTDTFNVMLMSSAYNPQPLASTWAAATLWSLGSFIVYGGKYYEVTTAGYSGGTIPTFPTDRGDTIVDNSMVWTCWGFSPPSTHSILSEVSANEITGTGYTAGGAALSGMTLTMSRHQTTLTANPVQWAGLIATMRYALIYKVGTANGRVNPLVAYVLLDNAGGNISLPSAGLFSMTWPASGIFTISSAIV